MFIAELTGTPWLIDDRFLTSAVNSLAASPEMTKLRGIRWAADSIRSKQPRATKIGVLPLMGIIEQRQSLFGQIYGGTSTEDFGSEFDSMVASPNVSTIVILVDSPGGTAEGVQELSDKIYAARNKKPIAAAVSPFAASAAYWIASAAERIYVQPSGAAGSIGVYSMHTEFSKADALAGVTTTIIRRPEFKIEMNPMEPLTTEARAYEQQQIDEIYSSFVGAVARNRGVSVSTVKNDFGKGRTMGAAAAVRAGVADSVMDSDTVLGALRTTGKLPGDPWWRAANERERRRLVDKGVLPEPGTLATLQGYAVIWNKLSIKQRDKAGNTFTEIVSPTAFDHVLDSAEEVTFTENHNYDFPIARRTLGDVRLFKDTVGIRCEIDLPRTADAENLLKKMRAGKCKGMSFTTRKYFDQHECTGGIRYLKRGDLHEICAVTEDLPSWEETWLRIKP